MNAILISSVVALVVAAALMHLNLQRLRMKNCSKACGNPHRPGCTCPPNYYMIVAIAAAAGCACYLAMVYV
jgi:hypothetical protein